MLKLLDTANMEFVNMILDFVISCDLALTTRRILFDYSMYKDVLVKLKMILMVFIALKGTHFLFLFMCLCKDINTNILE